VEVLDVGREDVGVGLPGVEDDRLAAPERDDLERLHLAAGQVIPMLGDEAVDEAVGLLGVGVDRARRTAHVLDDPHVSLRVGLHPLETALADGAEEIVHLGREIEGRLPHPAVCASLEAEEQTLGERVPGRSIEHWQRLSVPVTGRHQRHPVIRIRIEIDPGDVAGAPGLVTLEQKMGPVVVLRVISTLTVEHEVGVLVRLGLARLDLVRRHDAGKVAWCWEEWTVTVVAVEADADGVAPDGDARGVLQWVRTLGHHSLCELGREAVRRAETGGFGIRIRHSGQWNCPSRSSGQESQGGTDHRETQCLHVLGLPLCRAGACGRAGVDGLRGSPASSR
jgi:hypothetical protein